MKAVVYHEHGDAGALAIEDWPDTPPGPGEARVKVGAAALNGFDPMILMKTTSLQNPIPMIPCGDAAGEIVELGPDVSGDWKVGDRVSLLPWDDHGMMGETKLGAAREYFCVSTDNLVPMPDGVSYEDAAALPVAYGTAHRMVLTRGAIQAGEKVLIHGAAGGVGVACIQLLKALGAEIVACASGAWKQERLKELGAHHVIDTASEDFVKASRDLFGRPSYGGDGGVDVVINYVGGDTWAKSLKVLKPQGRMLTCGASAGYDPQTDIRYIWSFEQSIIGSDGWFKEDQVALLDLVAKGELKPALHSVRPFAEAGQAMQELIDRKVFGKSILVPG